MEKSTRGMARRDRPSRFVPRAVLEEILRGGTFAAMGEVIDTLVVEDVSFAIQPGEIRSSIPRTWSVSWYPDRTPATSMV